MNNDCTVVLSPGKIKKKRKWNGSLVYNLRLQTNYKNCSACHDEQFRIFAFLYTDFTIMKELKSRRFELYL